MQQPRPAHRTTAITVSMALMLLTSVWTAPGQPPLAFDLVVYGGTAGGVITAVAAAREGLRVALLEPGTHVGGLVSGGLGVTDHGRKAVIGGYALEFFERVGKQYGEPVTWYFEPHVAEQVFQEMVREAGVQLFPGHRLRERTGVTRRGTQVERVTMENGTVFQARIFADATYEGDLLAQSGVSYTWGREGTTEFGEPLAGVRERMPRTHQFLVRVSPYDDRGRLLPEVSPGPKGEPGQADRNVQAYNFRICATDRPDNRVPFPKPPHYTASRYELLARMLAELDRVKRAASSTDAGSMPASLDPSQHVNAKWSLVDVMQPRPLKNGKFDVNNNGAFSSDYIGGNSAYADGDYRTRATVHQQHIEYVQGFYYFLANDPRVPQPLHEAIAPWGLCKDEFVDTGNWPHQLYVREARRMRGEFVMSQRDVQSELAKSDSIGMGSYGIDAHNAQRVPTTDGFVENEGDLVAPVQPYQIPYRLILPKRTEVTNLLVPVAFSATHVAYATLRMEPQYMIAGHAAGVAAKLAVDAGVAVQDVDRAALTAKLRAQHAVLELDTSQPSR
jgi:hypothetical protein